MSLVTRQGKGSALTIVEMDSNFLYLEQLALSGTGSTGGGGTGSSNPLVSVTKTELDTLVEGNALVPGQLYKISGVHKNKLDQEGGGWLHEVLYDDGTDSGITVYLTALTGNILGSDGYGEFYNPNYYDINSYNNEDGTGLYGIWDGNNPDGSPTYSLNQVAYWGGYAWRNKTGDSGYDEDAVTLNEFDWEKLPYTDSHYTKVVDYIEYDYNTDFIFRRSNKKNDIDVFIKLETYQWDFGTDLHPIAVIPWGLYPKITLGIDDEVGGISGVHVNDAYAELVNFKGYSCADIKISRYSSIENNYLGKNCYFYNINMTDWSDIENNTITGDIENILMTDGSGIYNNTIIGGNLNDCRLNNGNISNNILETGSIYGNIIDNSSISNNTFSSGYGYIASNTLYKNSTINGNTGPGGIGNCVLTTNSQIDNNQLNSYYISSHDFSTNSGIGNMILGGNLQYFRLFNSFVNFSSMANNISNVSADNLSNGMSISPPNINSAFFIYQSYAKSLAKGPTNSAYYVNHFSGTQSQYNEIQF